MTGSATMGLDGKAWRMISHGVNNVIFTTRYTPSPSPRPPFHQQPVPDLSGGDGEELPICDPWQHPGQSAQRLVQHLILVPWRHLVPPVAHKQGGGRVKSLVTALRRLT